MRFGSLFAGIGGIDLGLERAGMTCAWQVEIDEYARRVLAKHWPDVPRWDDVRTFPPEPSSDWSCDLIAGGFPCQDISEANAKAVGIHGPRSGLWKQFVRILGVLRPNLAIVENVAALTFRGLDRVLGDLAEIGFDAEWSVVSACALDAPHTRERLFIVAYPASDQWGSFRPEGRILGQRGDLLHERRREDAGWCGVPHEVCDRPWSARPELYGVAHGVPARVDRINGLGNAVVPQVAEWIGRQILVHLGTQGERHGS